MEKINNDIYQTLGKKWYCADDDPVAILRAESKIKSPWVTQKIKERFNLGPETSVLDVGCGAGFLSNDLARTGLRVTGIDLSDESLKVARNFDKTNSVQYQKADAYHLPFSHGSFDVVTAMDFLEHVENPARVIEEVSRVLRPGGQFMFHTFNRNPLSYIVIIKMLEWLVKNTPKNLHVLELFIRPEELITYCQKSHMKVIELKGIKPVISSITWKSLFTGIVPRTFRFEFTKSLSLSYLGLAIKEGPVPNRKFNH